ncbi:lipoprotein-releasing ABC transporter permease subunit [Desulfococcus multivorans]|nr:lipoprotein-releasing ABC transporter permease subunit [Desulfococcus multivorans]AQV02969.1 ABC transporter permease [Desulfococcus multivorans]
MGFELFIAGRYLRARRKYRFISLITFLSVAGVTVGVMALIVVIAVMAGFESDLKKRILGIDPHIVLERSDGQLTDYQRLCERMKAFDGVTSAAPFITTQTLLRSGVGIAGSVVRGIDPNAVDVVIQGMENLGLTALRDLERDDAGSDPALPGIVLGHELARSLGVIEQDQLYLISPRGMVSPVGHMPAMKRFRVVGIFETGMYEYDGSLAFIRLEDAQQMLRMGRTVTGIEMRVDDIYDAGKIVKSILKELGASYTARDWMEMNRNFFSALKLEKTMMFILLTLIVLVAAFNISSSLIMMVMEKTRDIAILKAMGATNDAIRRIFVFKGVAVGIFGTLLGGGLGTLLCLLLKRYEFVKLPSDVYYITTLPVQLEWSMVVLIGLSTLAICLLATLYPAGRAAGLNPSEALRHG